MKDSRSESSYRVIALDEIEALPGPDTLTWRPVRATLGLKAFGTNAYTAAEAGEDVVEPHTESEHEELYFVFRGSARFILDGETFDASAGTYVHLPDPKVHRHAVAIEPGTTVMSFGGPPPRGPTPAGDAGHELRRPADVRAQPVGVVLPRRPAVPDRARPGPRDPR